MQRMVGPGTSGSGASTPKPLAVDYSALTAGAEKLEGVADDVVAGRLTGVPTGAGVYGDPALASCVNRVVAALAGRSDALAGEVDRCALAIRDAVRDYQEVDAQVAEDFERIGRTHGRRGAFAPMGSTLVR